MNISKGSNTNSNFRPNILVSKKQSVSTCNSNNSGSGNKDPFSAPLPPQQQSHLLFAIPSNELDSNSKIPKSSGLEIDQRQNQSLVTALDFLQPQTQQCAPANTATVTFAPKLASAQRHNTAHDDNIQRVIKQGDILCTRTEQWYTKKTSEDEQDFELRRVRLRWRQFKAILFADKLQLFHITKIALKAKESPVAAHTIYLLNDSSYHHHVRLFLISAQDAIWALQFIHVETKRPVTFHFQCNSLAQARDWYMALYMILPNYTFCKKPIPAFVDVEVLLQQQDQSKFKVKIRVPLNERMLVSSSKKPQTNNNSDVVLSAVWELLKKKGLLNKLPETTVTKEDLRLCWKSKDKEKREEEQQTKPAVVTAAKRLPTIVTGQIEWISKGTALIGPQLIERNHSLQLRSLKIEKERLVKTNQIKLTNFDSLLINKIFYQIRIGKQTKTKCKKTYLYAVLYGHHVFLFDKSHYNHYKRLLQQNNNSSSSKVNRWFSSTAAAIITTAAALPHRTATTMSSNSQSSPYLMSSSAPNTSLHTTLNVSNLLHATSLIDLCEIQRAQPTVTKGSSYSSSNTFELHIKQQRYGEGYTLYYEAPNTQIMLEWVTLINNKLRYGHSHIPQVLHYHENKLKNIMQSGELFIKLNYKSAFKPFYCVLYKDETHRDGGTLVLFNTIRKKAYSSASLFCFFDDNVERTARGNHSDSHSDVTHDDDDIQEHHTTALPLYTQYRKLLHLDQAYVYSGDECVIDDPLMNAYTKEPFRYQKDGTITGGDRTSDCIFVIWQLHKRHRLIYLREHLSLFKKGHHLGNKGTCWVFKAKSKQERDAWVWALHYEFEQAVK